MTRHDRLFLIACLAVMLLAVPCPADVVVLSNRSDRAIQVTPEQNRLSAAPFRLPPEESRPVFFSGNLRIRAEQAGSRQQFRAIAGRAYYFARTDNGLVVQQIGLNDKSTPLAFGDYHGRDKSGGTTSRREPTTVAVKLLIDDDEPTRQNVWEPRLRKRLAAVSAVFEQHAGIRLRIAAIERWDSDDRQRDFSRTLKEFEQEVDPSPAQVAIGFSSQYRVQKGRFHLGGTRGALHSHILIKERAPNVLESERRELLVHELGHFFGASHSPEENSVMRPLLSGGQQRKAGATIKFDPVNTLLIALMGDEMRRDKVNKLSDVSPATRRRMGEIYAALEPTLPADPATAHYRKLVAAAGASALINDVGTVTDRIVEVARRQAGEVPGPPSLDHEENHAGDRLLELYVREAAQAALATGSENGPRAFALAVGLVIDDTGLLRRLPTTSKVAGILEDDRRLRQRIEAMGEPTMYGRSDLAKHFFLSAHLTAAVGTQAARGAGLAKEMLDARGGSGFSFADMAANRAGIVFATAVIGKRLALTELAEQFEVDSFLPPIEELTEGLDADEFRLQFGDVGDPRFQAEMRRIEAMIQALPVYRGAR